MCHLRADRSLFALAVAFTLAACTKSDSLTAFAKSARDVTAAATTGYKRFNTEFTDARRDTAIVNGKPVSRDTFERILDRNSRGPVRLAALDHLAQYATALEGLAGKDVSPDLKQSALDIKASLTGLNESATKLGAGSSLISAKDIGLISGAAAVVADTYVRVKRERAIRAVVQKANPAVSEISRLLGREFPALGQTLRGELEAASSDLRDIVNDPQAKLSTEARLNFGRAAQKLFDDAQMAPAAFDTVAQAAAKMGKAHEKLSHAASGGKLTSVEFATALSDFIAQAQKTKKLFEEVSKT
jgi:hypothetical protein